MGGTGNTMAAVVHAKLHVFEHRQGFEGTHDLVRTGYASLHQSRGVHAGDVAAAQVYSSCRWRSCTGDHAEQRSLAGAIGSDEAANLSFWNVKAHVLQGGHSPKELRQGLNFQNLHVFS